MPNFDSLHRPNLAALANSAISLATTSPLPPPLLQFHTATQLLQSDLLLLPSHSPPLRFPPLPPALLSEGSLPYPSRLAACLPAWRSLTDAVLAPAAAARVLSIVRDGFDPNIDPSTQPFQRHNASSCNVHSAFLDTELAKLSLLGILRRINQSAARGVLSMSVQQQQSGLRLVVDGSPLNHPDTTTPEPTFTLEGVPHLATFLRPGDQVTTFDVRRLFYHIPLHTRAQPWYCIQWRGACYAFCSLPLGLQQSPAIANLLMSPAIAALRRAIAIRCAQYVDDAAIAGVTTQENHFFSSVYTSLLARLGFLLHPVKCFPTPSTSFRFLGFQFDTAAHADEVIVRMLPSKRAMLVDATRQLMRKMRHSESTTAPRSLPSAGDPPPTLLHVQQLARFLGAIRANLLAFLPVLAITRSLQRALATAVTDSGWRGTVIVTPAIAAACLPELAVLRASLAAELWTSRPLALPETADIVLTTDAAGEWGWGAYLSSPDNVDVPIAIAQDQWPPSTTPLPPLPSFAEVLSIITQRTSCPITSQLEHTASLLDRLLFNDHLSLLPRAAINAQLGDTHITVLETLAILNAILSLANLLQGRRLYARTDNLAALAALLKPGRSRTGPLAQLSLLIHFSLATLSCRLVAATHLPGTANTIADAASRRWLAHREHLEWPLSHNGYLGMLQRLGLSSFPAIDAFASSSNTKAEQYFSAFPDPRALAVDAMAQSWSGLDLFINPPFAMASLVVAKIIRDRPRSAVVLLPDWPHQLWHHLLSVNSHLLSTTHVPSSAIDVGPNRPLPEPLRNPKWQLRSWWLAYEPPTPTSPRC